MRYRISPVWWPALAASAPLTVPALIKRAKRFERDKQRAEAINKRRLDEIEPIDLPTLIKLDLTVLMDFKTAPGFKGDAGVSYFFKTDRGSLLFDVGFGPMNDHLAHNAGKLDFQLSQAESLAVSHLHPDHMGGAKASKLKTVMTPQALGEPANMPCWLPDHAEADGFSPQVVRKPRMLTGGVASTGSLARPLFFLGWTEEQMLIAKIKDKGAVIVTGCGHPGIERIIELTRKLTDEPIYAIIGGLHMPMTDSPNSMFGVKFQMVMGTGKPPWDPITEDDLQKAIDAINEASPEKVYLSGHDSCDNALETFEREIDGDVAVLEAGRNYII